MLYADHEKYKIYSGKMQEELLNLADNSIDAIVTDPPYELNFMGKGWDNSGVAFQKETWEHCLRVLKPGGYLLAFGGSRTFHRIACAIEDAGFDIRDTIMWLYGSGFPKSMNVGLAIDKSNGVESEVVGTLKSGSTSKAFNDYQYRIDQGIYSTSGNYEIKRAQNEWDGWGTALKPAFEPIIVARKPFSGSLIDNVQKNGVGALNIDGCRIPTDEYIYNHGNSNGTIDSVSVGNYGKSEKGENRSTELGRFPSNVILTYDETDEKEVCCGFPDSKGASSQNNYSNGHIYRGQSLQESETSLNGYREWYNDNGSAARYFYCAKASKKDRDEGLYFVDEKSGGTYQFRQDGKLDGKIPNRKNIHPTVKPTELMQYLIRLVAPKGATILDPFMGSGSTGKACMFENTGRQADYKFIGVEMTEQYLPIAKARIEFGMSPIKCDVSTSQGQTKCKKRGLF